MELGMYSAVIVALPIISPGIALLLCLFAEPISRGLGLIDNPGGRKSHKSPTPLMGGIVLLCSFFPLVALWAISRDPETAHIGIAAMTCGAILTILGMIDDRRHLSATLRLAICFAVTAMTVWAVPQFQISAITWNYRTDGVTIGPFAIAATVLCVVSLIQAANMADGKNGLLISLCLGWSFVLRGWMPTSFEMPMLMLISVLLVLLAFNLSGKLFLGDGGSYGLATFIGLLAAYCSNNGRHPISADQFGLLFLLPVLDMIRLLGARTMRGQSPFGGDRDHLHHHLLRAFGWPGGLVVYLMGSVLPSLLAASAPRHTLLIIAMTIAGYFALIYYARRIGNQKEA